MLISVHTTQCQSDTETETTLSAPEEFCLSRAIQMFALLLLLLLLLLL